MKKVIKMLQEHVNKVCYFDKRFDAVLTEEIRTTNCCIEVFVIPEGFMNKLNKLKLFSFMSPLHAIVI